MGTNCCKKIIYGSMVIALAITSGCATHGKGMKQTLDAMARGDYATSIKEVEKNYGQKESERLIYNMEMGLIKHLDGQYKISNRNLQVAADFAEELETKRAGNLLKTALTNPRSGPYRGTKFEKVFLHYYKAMNYIQLAVEHPEKMIDYIESARVEARQIDIKLTAIQNEEGTYQEARDKKQRLFGKLMSIFNALEGKMDKDKLIYREDAYVRYLTGLVYEQNGEIDEARISYQNAAELYEKGYAEQYGLGNDIAELAWFDAIRMMRDSGGWEGEWQKIAEEKLSSTKREKLDRFNPGSGQLVIIQDTGLVPARDELNIQLTMDVSGKALVLKPWLTGDPQERNDQMSWFFSMYSEKGVISAISNYVDRGLAGAVQGLYTKRISLAPAWSLVKDVKLEETLGLLGARVTVPYYRPFHADFGETLISVNGKHSGTLVNSESIAQLAIQEQFLNADSDLQSAVAREVLKNTLATQTGEKLGGLLKGGDAGKALGDLLSFVGKVASAATSAAETRNWLTLPYVIRIQRIALPPGSHDIKLITSSIHRGLKYNEVNKEVKVKAGKISVLSHRAVMALGR